MILLYLGSGSDLAQRSFAVLRGQSYSQTHRKNAAQLLCLTSFSSFLYHSPTPPIQCFQNLDYIDLFLYHFSIVLQGLFWVPCYLANILPEAFECIYLMLFYIGLLLMLILINICLLTCTSPKAIKKETVHKSLFRFQVCETLRATEIRILTRAK